jgi:hypothetical protein
LRKYTLVAMACLVATGCGQGARDHAAVSPSPKGERPGSADGPLPSGSPVGDNYAGICSTISYRVTSAGVEISAKVTAVPATINFEADDKDDNPVTGDPASSGVTYAFKGSDTQRVLTIKGVRSLDHLTVIALGHDASCQASRR